MIEKIYSLTLDIKNPNVPFNIERSISVQGGSLVEILSRFPLELTRLLREIHEQEKSNLRGDDDVPF